MSKGKSDSVEIPKYNQPAQQQFSLPGFGSTTYGNNMWGFQEDPGQAAYRNQLETMRMSVLKGLGITAPEREASLNQWQDTFTKEAMRTSMPQLEQTLFARGLGGSNFYQNAVTDLLSKIGTQGVLNREQLSQSDESMKLQQLASILGAGQNNLSNMSGLLSGATGQTNTNNQQAWNQYMQTLPYLSKVNAGGNTDWGSIGGLAGMGGLGLASLLIPGAGIGLAGLTGLQMAGLGGAAGGALGSIFGGK